MIIFLLLVFVPIGASAARYFLAGDGRGNWQTADRSSAGILPPLATHPEALIRVFAARTVRWRSIFAVHTWLVIKEQGAATYSRYDYTAWGDPIRSNGFAADARWFGATPEPLWRSTGERRADSSRKFGMSSIIINSVPMATIAPGRARIPTRSFRPCSMRT